MNATPGTGNTARRVPSKRLSPRIVEVRRKQAEAARLFALGVPLREIAAQVGYESKAGASRAVKSVLNRSDSVEAETIRAAHEERLGAGYRATFEILHRVFPPIVVPNGMDAAEGRKWVGRVAAVLEERAELRLKAVDRLLRLMEREARLHGIDAPTRTELSGDGSISVLFASALRPHPAAEIAEIEGVGEIM